jgi:outer membrane protein assembly factor BamB
VAPDAAINKDWAARAPKTLWTVALTDEGHAGPCVADGKVFIVDHRNNQDLVRALDFATGKDLWAFAYADATANRYGFTESTPLWAAGRLYIFSRKGKALALDAATGQLLWKRDLYRDFSGRTPEWDYAASPVLVGDKIIICPGGKDAAVVALDAATGRTVWHGAGDARPSYSTPVIATINGRQQIVVFIADGLSGVDPATGARLWNQPWPVLHDQQTATPIVSGNRIFITTAWDSACALVEVGPSGPHLLWKNKEMQSRVPSPVFCHGRFFGSLDPDDLVCLDAATGAPVWKQHGFQQVSVLAVGGNVIALDGASGDLVLLDAGAPSYHELGRFRPLSGKEFWTAPILASGRLLIRSKSTLACVDLR